MENYILVQQLGEGGFADVWEARHTPSSTLAAIKIFVPRRFQRDGADDRVDALTRFCEGAHRMRSLSSQRVVRILGEVTVTGPYIWFPMELLETDLEKALAGGTLSEVDRIQIGADVLEAVTIAHAARPSPVLHRDVRPPNVLLRREAGEWRGVLADFDIAYYEFRTEPRGSTIAALPGDLSYLPPEIVKATIGHKELLRRPTNDIYAVGVLVFRMFAIEGTAEPIPDDPTASVLRRRLRRRDKSGAGFGWYTRRLVAGFCATCLATRSDRRVRTAVDATRLWLLVGKPPARSVFAKAALVALIVAAVVGIDAMAAHWRMLASQISSTLLALTGVGAVVFLCAKAKTIAERYLLPFFAVRRAVWSILTSIGAVLVALTVAWATDLATRYRTCYLVGGGGCEQFSEAGQSRGATHEDGPQLIDVYEVSALRCPEESVVQIFRRSLLASPPGVMRVKASSNSESRPPVLSGSAPSPAADAKPCIETMKFIRGGALKIGTGELVSVESFCMDTTEVTAGAMIGCVHGGGCPAPKGRCGENDTFPVSARTDHPMNCVSYEEAFEFCQRQGMALPTEAQWELAARGASGKRRYPWGTEPPAYQVCWSGKRSQKGTCKVGEYSGISPEGVADLTGNVFEWTRTALPDGRRQIAKGGSWNSSDAEHDLLPTLRAEFEPTAREDYLGFRCVAPPAASGGRP